MLTVQRLTRRSAFVDRGFAFRLQESSYGSASTPCRLAPAEIEGYWFKVHHLGFTSLRNILNLKHEAEGGELLEPLDVGEPLELPPRGVRGQGPPSFNGLQMQSLTVRLCSSKRKESRLI